MLAFKKLLNITFQNSIRLEVKFVILVNSYSNKFMKTTFDWFSMTSLRNILEFKNLPNYRKAIHISNDNTCQIFRPYFHSLHLIER